MTENIELYGSTGPVLRFGREKVVPLPASGGVAIYRLLQPRAVNVCVPGLIGSPRASVVDVDSCCRSE